MQEMCEVSSMKHITAVECDKLLLIVTAAEPLKVHISSSLPSGIYIIPLDMMCPSRKVHVDPDMFSKHVVKTCYTPVI